MNIRWRNLHERFSRKPKQTWKNSEIDTTIKVLEKYDIVEKERLPEGKIRKIVGEIR
jgi:hypothetical protein